MRIAVTSDLHGNLPNIEPCDILLTIKKMKIEK